MLRKWSKRSGYAIDRELCQARSLETSDLARCGFPLVIGAFVLFGNWLARQFFLYAGIAIVAGIFVFVAYPTHVGFPSSALD